MKSSKLPATSIFPLMKSSVKVAKEIFFPALYPERVAFVLVTIKSKGLVYITLSVLVVLSYLLNF